MTAGQCAWRSGREEVFIMNLIDRASDPKVDTGFGINPMLNFLNLEHLIRLQMIPLKAGCSSEEFGEMSIDRMTEENDTEAPIEQICIDLCEKLISEREIQCANPSAGFK